MKNLKIKASNRKEAYDIQQTLFKLGYGWTVGEPQTAQYPEALTFFTYSSGMLRHSNDDFGYFDEHENTEETLESLQTLLAEKVIVKEDTPQPTEDAVNKTKHSHYHKDVSHLKTIDVYRVMELWGITSPPLQHAVKKLMVPGGRGAGKDMAKNVQEAIDSLIRWQEMQVEDTLSAKALAKAKEEC